MDTSVVMKKIKKVWWFNLALIVVLTILPEFIVLEQGAMTTGELHLFKKVFYGVSLGLIAFSFAIPSLAFKNKSDDDKIKEFFGVYLMSMFLPSASICTYGLVLNLFTLKEEGLILNALALLLLAYKFPRDSQVELTLGETLAERLLKEQKS